MRESKLERSANPYTVDIAISNMTVGFLYDAGAETLIFVTGTSGKDLTLGRQTKSAVYTQKTNRNNR